ncbi:hypothetical protein KAR91_44145 [Candidatus Pacearchaeota archaeon]|nr:hypothetical protein [Candidatus Pacearchaeota archaeon]
MLEIDSIRLTIKHKAAKGSEAELAFKRIIRKHLPQRYRLGSGFILNGNMISHQHDVVVYDDFINTPIYLGENFSSFLGGSVYGVMEITMGKLGTTKLEKDIEKIGNLRKMFSEGKVAFQKVVSCPIISEDEFKNVIDGCLSSGYSTEDVWCEVKDKCLSEEGAINIGDILGLESIDSYDKRTIFELIDNYSKYSSKYVVKEKIAFNTPPPRTYLCALGGSSYRSIGGLAKATKRLTKKYGAHVHGLLVLNNDGEDWLLSTQAFKNYGVEMIEEDSFFKFLEKLKKDFQGMWVGKYPAADKP